MVEPINCDLTNNEDCLFNDLSEIRDLIHIMHHLHLHPMDMDPPLPGSGDAV